MTNRFEETKRLGRVLEIIQIIAVAPKRYRTKDLAERFEISDRMVKKDFEVIRNRLCLTLRPSSEGYYFEDMPKLPAVQFPFTDALALLMAVQAAQPLSGGGTPELAAAISRLEAQFPIEFKPLLHRLSSQSAVSVQGRHRHEMLMLLNRALVEGCKVLMTYATRSRGGDVTRRVVQPYHLMPYVRSWQLVAYCELREKVLMFKLDRIQDATLLDARYRVPADFDLDSYLGWAWGIIRGDAQPPEDIELWFGADTGHRVIEEDWHPSQEAEVLADGRVKFTLRATITPELVAWLLYYGSRVEVVQPMWLRERVAAEHREAAGMYRFEHSNLEVEQHA